LSFFEPSFPESGDLELSAENARIARSVLRLVRGDRVDLLDGKGRVARAAVAEVGKRSAAVRIESVARHERPVPRITLLQGLPKGEKADFVVQKACELGVEKLVFIATEFAVPRGGAKADRWRRIAVEALRQSGNPFLPEILGPLPLEAALSAHLSEANLLFDETEPGRTLKQAFAIAPSVSLAVGPEGGFSAAEREAFVAAGFVPVRLGPYVLRTETAAVAAVAAVTALADPVAAGGGIR
jgi:16S rRNA (uracil1498-N3)-methyltransferase